MNAEGTTLKRLVLAMATAVAVGGLAACDRGDEGTPDPLDQTGEVEPYDVQPREAHEQPVDPEQAGEPAANGMAQEQGAEGDMLGGMQPEEIEFGALDQDGDGYIDREEARALPILEQNFDRYDTSQEGRIDESEFAVFLEELQGQMDEAPVPGGAGTTPGHTGIPPDRRIDGVEPEAMEPGEGESTSPTDRGL
ncbi:hypothetical protein HUS23_13850 [Ectothiorhodospiraceae bacterium 2226]|nr:hypothetical protein HUS23_13850 [Ectothiorhodospiraceae bacterium 2226]